MTKNFEHVWDLPEPNAIETVKVEHDAEIILRRHGNPEGPRLLLSHGNGLAIDLYYPFWSLLTDQFDLVIYDLRNHGWNRVSEIANHTLWNMIDDLGIVRREISRLFGEKPTVGVFHSVSSMTVLLSQDKGDNFDGLVLFDPPLCKPGKSYHDLDDAAERVADLANQRAHRFKDPSELSAILPYLPNFQRVVSGIPELFVNTTLKPADDGSGFELRCPREYEAQIIRYAGVYGSLVDFSSFKCPIKVIGADPTLPYAYLPTLDLGDAIGVDYDFLPEATHFLQLEQPKQCAEILTEFVKTIFNSPPP